MACHFGVQSARGRTRKRSLFCTAAMVAMTLPAAGMAQGGARDEPVELVSEDAPKERIIEEIFVTARKRSETLIETPTSISVFSDSKLDALNATNLEQVGKYVPNLNINRFGVGNPSQAAIFIRGIGLQDHLIVTDPAVSVYLDGVYLGRQMGSNLSLQNIERIEVLRGPQGTLYGRNSIGGAVNIITRQPGAEEVVELEARAGTRERVDANVYANTRLTDDFAVVVNAGFQRRAGVGEAVNLDNPSKEIGEILEVRGRVSGVWDVSDDFSVTFSVDGTDGEFGQSPYEIEILTPEQLTDITGSPIPAGVAFFGTPLLTEDDLVDRDDLGTNVAGLESTSVEMFGASMTLDWDMNEVFRSKFLASYRTMSYEGGLDDDDTIFNLSEFPEEGEATQVSLELQVNAEFDRWDLVGGLYYFYEDGSVFSGPFTFAPFNTAGPNDFFTQAQTAESYAGYLNASYRVTDRLTVGAGVRYTDDEKDASAFFPGFAARDFETASFDAITAEANVRYAITDDLNIYAQIQRGYQTGGFPPRPFVGGEAAFEAFDEQTALNYEVGFKGQVADFWRILFAAFWTEYDDLALNVSVPQAGGFLTLVDNVGSSRSRGIEVESQLSFANGFFLNTTLGFLDAEITEVGTPVSGAIIPIEEGSEPALTPELTISAVTGYQYLLPQGGSFNVQVDYSFRDDMFGQPVNTEPEILEERSLVGFNAFYESRDGSWTLGVYGENIFDEIYSQGRLNNTFHGFVGVVLNNDRSEFGALFTKRF